MPLTTRMLMAYAIGDEGAQALQTLRGEVTKNTVSIDVGLDEAAEKLLRATSSSRRAVFGITLFGDDATYRALFVGTVMATKISQLAEQPAVAHLDIYVPDGLRGFWL